MTKNAECHNHSQLELMLNKSALSVFSNWAPQKPVSQVPEEINIKKQRDQTYKSELLEEEGVSLQNNQISFAIVNRFSTSKITLESIESRTR